MNDLELLREMMKDTRLHIGIGLIVGLGLSLGGNILRVTVNLIPENRQVICEMTFADVCSITFPEVDDLCLVLFADGHPDDAFVVKVVNTSDEKIPLFAQTGDTVTYSRPGKRLFLGSDTLVGIGRPNVMPTEPLVLGATLTNYLQALVGHLADLIDGFVNNPVVISSVPGNLAPINPALATIIDAIKASLNADKSTYLTTTSTNILSQIAFTERGV